MLRIGVVAGVLLLRPAWRRLGGWFSTGLLAIFTAYFAINYETLKGADCSCFPWIERTVGPAFFWSESVMIALSLAAAWFAPPMRKLGTAVKAVAAIAAVSFVALAIDKLGPQLDADVPASIQTDAGEFSLHQGKVFLYFFNPLCPHCEDAAKRMSQLTWKAAYVAVPTQDAHFGPGALDVLATAMRFGGRADDLAGLDLAYAPPFDNERVRRRFAFMDPAGDRWWAVGGAVYMLQAIKRVRGMRLITPAWQEKDAREKALVAAAKRQANDPAKPAAHLRIVK